MMALAITAWLTGVIALLVFADRIGRIAIAMEKLAQAIETEDCDDDETSR